jgi:hypothetical protein
VDAHKEMAMTQTMPDDLWREFPKTATEFEARFATEEDCRAYYRAFLAHYRAFLARRRGRHRCITERF